MSITIAALLSLAAQMAPTPSPTPEQIYSGPQVGETVSAFKVLSMTGAAKGQEITIESSGKPRVIVFIGKLERIAGQYLRMVNDYVRNHPESLDGLFVSLTSDLNGEERHLPAVIESLKADSMAISLDGQEGPGALGLNVKVMLTTLLVGKDGKVLCNQALVSPSAAVDFPKLAAEMDKLPVPSLESKSKDELIKMIQELRRQLTEEKMKGAPAKPKGRGEGMNGGGEMKEPAASGLSKEEEDMIRETGRPALRESDPKKVEVVLKQVLDYCGDNAARKKFWIGILEIIVKANYGTDAGKPVFKAELAKLKS